MAEDGLQGFKFHDSDDIAKDAALLEVSNVLFSEVSFGRMGAKVEESLAAKKFEPVRDVGPSDDFDSFDFGEGFDFIL